MGGPAKQAYCCANYGVGCPTTQPQTPATTPGPTPITNPITVPPTNPPTQPTAPPGPVDPWNCAVDPEYLWLPAKKEWLLELASRLVCAQEGVVLPAREQGLPDCRRLCVDCVRLYRVRDLIEVLCAGLCAIFGRIGPLVCRRLIHLDLCAGPSAIFGRTWPPVCRPVTHLVRWPLCHLLARKCV